MKNIFLLLLGLMVVCFLFLKKDEEEIRIRVISNSGQDSDIYYKEEVVEYLKNEILANRKLNEDYFKRNYKVIEKELNEKFENITVSYDKHYFVNKTEDNIILENKLYNTLLIYIGDGEGPNWWGSIFDETLQFESEEAITYKWYFFN